MQITLEIGVIATIISVIVSGLISFKVAKSQRVIEIITTNRVKWIQEVKELFSEYFLYTQYYDTKKLPEDNFENLNKLNEITNKIKLQLNLKGPKDRKIINLISELNLAYAKLNFINPDNTYIRDKITREISLEYVNRFMDNLDYENCEESRLKEAVASDVKSALRIIMNQKDLIEIYVKIYLKCEWERVKLEARKGINTKYDFEKKYTKIEEYMKTEIEEIEDRIKNKKNPK